MGRVKEVRGLYLAKKIRSSYPYGFTGAIVTGERGIGKSSFALNIAWEVFRELIDPDTNEYYTEDVSWRKALDSVVFTISDVIDAISAAAKRKDPLRILCWDDCGVYANTMSWWRERTLLDKLKAVLDTVRSGCTGLVLTTPSENDLSKVVRNYDDYIVQIRYSDDGGGYRVAKGYLKRTLPSGSKRIYLKFRNRFVVTLPDWVFSEYMEHRDRVFQDQLEYLKQNI